MRYTSPFLHDPKVELFGSQVPDRAHVQNRSNMAKSVRSRRKRKLRAEKRQKLKPKVKAKLEEIIGLKDKKMVVDAEKVEGGKSDETREKMLKKVKNQEPTSQNEDAGTLMNKQY